LLCLEIPFALVTDPVLETTDVRLCELDVARQHHHIDAGIVVCGLAVYIDSCTVPIDALQLLFRLFFEAGEARSGTLLNRIKFCVIFVSARVNRQLSGVPFTIDDDII